MVYADFYVGGKLPTGDEVTTLAINLTHFNDLLNDLLHEDKDISPDLFLDINFLVNVATTVCKTFNKNHKELFDKYAPKEFNEK